VIDAKIAKIMQHISTMARPSAAFLTALRITSAHLFRLINRHEEQA
jgi:hypothetical protein